MSKLVPTMVLGLAMTAAGCAHHSQKSVAQKIEPKASWRCPEGTYPDLTQKGPNCNSNTPWTQASVDQGVQAGKSSISFSCPAGLYPDSTQPMPNCLSRTLNTTMPVAGVSDEELQKQLQAARDEGQRQAEEQYKAQLAEMEQQGESNEEGQKIELTKRVAFSTSSTELTSASKATLDEVAENIKSNEDVEKIVVEGHADSTGSTAGNEKLSEARAQNIAEYLEQKGVPSEKIETVAFGDEKPIASNDSAAGRALNRSAAIVALK